MKAKDLMTLTPECVTRTDTVQQAARIMRDLDVGFVPVVEDRTTMRLAGVITDRDIAIRCVAEGFRDGSTVGEHMTTGFIARVEPDADIADVVQQMQERQIRRIAVVEGEDKLVGVIAQADLATEVPDPEEIAATVARISEPAEPRR
jgi:CBS domain-containing protein